jgi:hypothetical protein
MLLSPSDVALACDKRRFGWNTTGTNALRAEGPGIALNAREPATVVSAQDAPTAKEQAANRRSQPVEKLGRPKHQRRGNRTCSLTSAGSSDSSKARMSAGTVRDGCCASAQRSIASQREGETLKGRSRLRPHSITPSKSRMLSRRRTRRGSPIAI